MNDIFVDDPTTDGNVPQSFQDVQKLLDQFVAVGYNATYNALQSHSGSDNADYLRNRIVTILRDNPPFATLPKYLRDGRENYLWYSDFYDDAGKEVFRQYNKFSAPEVNITPANYAEELNKVGLPYFEELVNLISLEKLYMEVEARLSHTKNQPAPVVEPAEDVKPVDEPEPVQPESPLPTEKPAAKQSYEPKLTTEQYVLLAKCIERIKLFRRPIKPAGLKKLFTGKLAEPLQVMNQLPLVYLLDLLRDAKLIKKAWMTTAVENRDFISFRTEGQERRYGSEPHYLTMEQLTSRRRDSKHNYITGGDDIDDTIESIRASMAK